MKSKVAIIMVFLALSCSDDNEDKNLIQEPVSNKIEIVSRNIESTLEHGKHKNYLSAKVINTTSASVKGLVRFQVKGYRNLDSDTQAVSNEKDSFTIFYASFESSQNISETDLLNA